MKRLKFYLAFARSNLLNNKQLYIPQLIISATLTAVFFIMYAICRDEEIKKGIGGEDLSQMIGIGVFMVGFVSMILLFYTNSFLMKQRKRDFGVFHVLGLEKKHIKGIMLLENCIMGVVSIVLGLMEGILLYKLCILFACKLLKLDATMGFGFIRVGNFLPTIALFVGIYVAVNLINLIKISIMKPIEMVKSDKLGEREPKNKWISLIFGTVILGVGYYLALSVQSPMTAIMIFFLAVLCVVVGTYFLFGSLSVFVLKMMKKNDRFYYHPRRMTAISGLLYRMKQNAVGLASICILSTAVLVMLSATIQTYAGIEDTTKKACPHDFEYSMFGGADRLEMYEKKGKEILTRAVEKEGLKVKSIEYQSYAQLSLDFQNGKLTCDMTKQTLESMTIVCVMTCQDYKNATGKVLQLKEGEIACFQGLSNYFEPEEELWINEKAYPIATKLSDFPISMSEYSLFNCFGIVVKDLEQIEAMSLKEESDIYCHVYFVDMTGTSEQKKIAEASCKRQMKAFLSGLDAKGGYKESGQGYEETFEMYYMLAGSLLFLGVVVGCVFLLVTVLIIYYKQISEGYEDRKRFKIMQQVGMTKQEVQKSIYSQIKLVFFSPLIVALVHILVAFPILVKMLRSLFSTDEITFFISMMVAYGIFVLVYFIIYTMTARIYYRIVKI